MSTSAQVDRYGRSLEEVRIMRERIEQCNAEAKTNWDNPQWRKEMAAEITETILWGFQHENLLSYMSEVENVGFDDRVFISEVRGLKAFWIARGGYIEASHMHRETMELPRDTIGFHVEEFTDKLLVNFAETQANLIDLGIQRLDAEVNLRFLRLFQAAVPSNSPYYISGSGLSLSAVNTALRAVREASRSRQVAIIGRATMTEQFVDQLTGVNSTFTAFLPSTNEQMLAQGLLGTYRGANIISLTNYLDEHNLPFFPSNELWIVARDASRFAFWGGLQAKEFEEQDNWYWHYLARKDFGGVVHRPERLRRVVDTSLPAETAVETVI